MKPLKGAQGTQPATAGNWVQEPHGTHQTWFVARGEIWGLILDPAGPPSHLPVQSSCAGSSSCSSACPPFPALTRVLVSLCLPEDVQVTDKITISKQFKEKVIRPILKVGGMGFRARVSAVLSFVHRVVRFKRRAPHQLPPRCEISHTTLIFRHPEARSGPCRER